MDRTHREWILTSQHDMQANLVEATELLTVLMKVGTSAREFPMKANGLHAQITALNNYHKQSPVMLVTSQQLTVTVLARTALGLTK